MDCSPRKIQGTILEEDEERISTNELEKQKKS